MKKIAILGGGSWGTALAMALGRSRQPHSLSLWVHNVELAKAMRERRINEVYLPGFELPREVEITHDAGTALDSVEIVLGVMPSRHARDFYVSILPHLHSRMVLVSATKGLDSKSFQRMTQVITEVCQPKFAAHVAALSGPSFAQEVARGDPTAVVVASADSDISKALQEEFSGPAFRLYTNRDVAGVELGGAAKNVVAIAAGACAGLGLGHNSVAALITRGLAEITRLACALGGRTETLAGLAGMGDLVLTCTGGLSRNRRLGIALGKGEPLEQILASTRMVAEGVPTTLAIWELSRRAGIEMPITEQMYAVLYQGRAPRDAIRELMDRQLKHE
jgi:glycerol-3-phosphate dehydrogenase (NAD(P)+)